MQNIHKSIRDQRLGKESRSRVILDLIEMILIIFAFPVSIWFTKWIFIPGIEVDTAEGILLFAFILISWFALSRIVNMAKIPRTRRYRTLIFQFARGTFIVFLGLLVFKVLLRLTTIPNLLIVVYATALFVITVFFRLSLFGALKLYRTYGYGSHNILIIADAFSDGIIEKLIKQKEWGFKIECIMSDSKMIKVKYGQHFHIISNKEEDLKNVIDRMIIDEVIYCRRDVDIEQIKKVSEICNEVKVLFRLQSSISPLEPAEFQLKTLNNSKGASIVDIPSNDILLVLKTMGDIYFSVLALVLLLPLLLLFGMIIKIGSKGPVIFSQERIGLRGRKFMMYKFRTMVVDAEAQLKRFSTLNEADGPVFKIKNDPRVTRFGRFLRKTGLDELPQLYNVIRGEMSLIGPRPPLEEEVKQYDRWQLQRLSVKPGISCTWQILQDRNDVSFEEWMKMDKHYIDNWNILKDIALFFKTVKTFFMAGGR